MKVIRKIAACLALALLVGGCRSAGMLALHTANTAARLGPYECQRDLSYGPDVRHALDVYVPRDLAERAPVVIFFHGGDWSDGYPDKDAYRFAGGALASRGLIAVVPNYHRYPAARFPRFVEDGALAVRWTLEHVDEHGGDPRAVFVMGHSAGAHIASLLAVEPSYLNDAGVDHRAIRGMIGMAGPYEFPPTSDDPLLSGLFGERQRYVHAQPVNYVDAYDPPMLLLTGGKDRRVPAQVTERMARSAYESGAPVTMQIYDDLDHIMLLASLAAPVRWHNTVLDDIAEWVWTQQASPPAPHRVPDGALVRQKPQAAQPVELASHDTEPVEEQAR